MMKKVTYLNGRIIGIAHSLNRLSHNLNGPSYLFYHEYDGYIQYVEYSKYGELDNYNCPARILFYKLNIIHYIEYYSKGTIHNKNGAAFITFYNNSYNKIEEKQYRYYGKHIEVYNDCDFFKFIKRLIIS